METKQKQLGFVPDTNNLKKEKKTQKKKVVVLRLHFPF